LQLIVGTKLHNSTHMKKVIVKIDKKHLKNKLTITHESYNIVQKCIFLIQEFDVEFNRLVFFYEIHYDHTKLSEIFKYRL
jgi:hypothetical protein